MKGISLSGGAPRAARLGLVFCLLAAAAVGARAQGPAEASANAGAAPTRLERARTLAAVGNLAAAAAELEAMRGEPADDSARDVARILLMSIYVMQGGYSRADTLLQETFDARTSGGEKPTRLYFALAGQLINGVRLRLDRYRDFGLNYTSLELPPEARADVDQMRSLLERVVEHARQIRNEAAENNNSKARGADAVALLEDAAAVRLRMVRTPGDRTRWQREVAEARQHLVATETRMPENVRASSRSTTNPPAAQPAAVASNTAPPTANPPARAEDNSASRGLGAPTASAPQTAATPAPSATPAPTQPSTGGTTQRTTAATAAASPLNLGSLVDHATEKVQPSYPPMARNMRIGGVVTVFLVVNEKGQVEAVQRTSGPNLLQQAAADAARRWKFRPVVVDGQPVRVSGYINFNFAL